MKKLKRKSKLTINIKTEPREAFFARGKHVARLLDKKEKISPSRTISFEDPADLISFLTQAKLTLLALIRKKPDSITKLAHKLHRSRAAVDKDVRLLESVGIVESEYVINPGHGRCRVIKAIDSNPIKLQVEATI